jgi:hypothetical protein
LKLLRNRILDAVTDSFLDSLFFFSFTPSPVPCNASQQELETIPCSYCSLLYGLPDDACTPKLNSTWNECICPRTGNNPVAEKISTNKAIYTSGEQLLICFGQTYFSPIGNEIIRSCRYVSDAKKWQVELHL